MLSTLLFPLAFNVSTHIQEVRVANGISSKPPARDRQLYFKPHPRTMRQPLDGGKNYTFQHSFLPIDLRFSLSTVA